MKSAQNGSRNMTILIDTNVILDILLNRQPWYTNAALIFGLSQKNIIKSYVSASAITDVFYLAQKRSDLQSCGNPIAVMFVFGYFIMRALTF